MKRAWKSYWAFTSKIYRFVVLLLFPLIAVLAMIVTGMIDTQLMPVVIVCYYIIFMIVEPMSDYWFLGGFYSKNKGALKFMQSSNRFPHMIRDVVVVDLLRRAATNVFVFLLMICVGVISQVEPDGYVVFVFFPVFEILLGEVTVLIGRHFDLWNHHYVVVLIGFIIMSLFMAYCIISAYAFLHWICLGTAAFAIVAAVVTVLYTNKKVRDSYYDK